MKTYELGSEETGDGLDTDDLFSECGLLAHWEGEIDAIQLDEALKALPGPIGLNKATS
jgi:hypothetical protein